MTEPIETTAGVGPVETDTDRECEFCSTGDHETCRLDDADDARRGQRCCCATRPAVALESYTITTECRVNRGDDGAWDEAVRRLRTVYNVQLARFGPSAAYRIEFHREPALGIPRYVYNAARESRPVVAPSRDGGPVDDEAVEQIARAAYLKVWPSGEWERESIGSILAWRADARDMISAALPVFRAQIEADIRAKIADEIAALPTGVSGACHVAVSFFRTNAARLARGSS